MLTKLLFWSFCQNKIEVKLIKSLFVWPLRFAWRMASCWADSQRSFLVILMITYRQLSTAVHRAVITPGLTLWRLVVWSACATRYATIAPWVMQPILDVGFLLDAPIGRYRTFHLKVSSGLVLMNFKSKRQGATQRLCRRQTRMIELFAES